MKTFKDRITLNRNSRGCYILDTVKGCRGCNPNRPRGCYDDCYAWNIAARYGRDFTQTVKRDFPQDKAQFGLFDFDDARHVSEIVQAIKRIDMPFIRIGEMGDPSEDWEHTLKVCGIISEARKPIVIITKHWESIPDRLLPDIRWLNLCINTSVSALDNEEELCHRLEQYNRVKQYCNSVLRIVSCDFNFDNPEGVRRIEIQDSLFRNNNTIDTVFRPSPQNPLVINGIINTKKVSFLRARVLQASITPMRTWAHARHARICVG
jgi:hypothetical protein